MKLIAQLVSVLFHPLFVPSFCLLTLMSFESIPASYFINESMYHLSLPAKEVLLILFVIFTIIAPLLSMVFFKLNGTISSYHIDNQKERTQPLLLSSFYLLFLFGFMLYELPEAMFPQIALYLPLIAAVTLLVAALVNRWLKISLHLLGMGSWCALLFVYDQFQLVYSLKILLFLFIISGIVGSARLFLDAHRPKEIYIAFGTGFIIAFLMLHLFVY